MTTFLLIFAGCAVMTIIVGCILIWNRPSINDEEMYEKKRRENLENPK